jgi:hypothetical protein
MNNNKKILKNKKCSLSAVILSKSWSTHPVIHLSEFFKIL